MENGQTPVGDDKPPSFTFLSNHAHVLVCLARNPDSRIRDVAMQVGITERAAFRILTELEQAEVIRRKKEGRRNRYEIELKSHLRHPLEKQRTVGSLLGIFLSPPRLQRVAKSHTKSTKSERKRSRL